APLLLQDDVASCRAEGDLHGVGELVQPALHTATSFLVESNHLCHSGFILLLAALAGSTPATDDARRAFTSRPPKRLALPARFCHSHGESANDIIGTLGVRVQAGSTTTQAAGAVSHLWSRLIMAAAGLIQCGSCRRYG